MDEYDVEDRDFYDGFGTALDDDEISAEEEGFMKGFLDDLSRSDFED
ncbi:hypothetical protein HYU18_01985 [Candidatus Woesearchaeota archaeon]|nr:hypothetical protein [Candidatus Woesearchaeota archaeon]